MKNKKILGYYGCNREMPALFLIRGMPPAWTDIVLCSLPKWAQMTAFLQLTTENKNREVQSSQSQGDHMRSLGVTIMLYIIYDCVFVSVHMHACKTFKIGWRVGMLQNLEKVKTVVGLRLAFLFDAHLVVPKEIREE